MLETKPAGLSHSRFLTQVKIPPEAVLWGTRWNHCKGRCSSEWAQLSWHKVLGQSASPDGIFATGKSLWQHIKARGWALGAPGQSWGQHSISAFVLWDSWGLSASQTLKPSCSFPPCFFSREDHKNATIIFTEGCMFAVRPMCLCLQTHLLRARQLF